MDPIQPASFIVEPLAVVAIHDRAPRASCLEAGLASANRARSGRASRAFANSRLMTEGAFRGGCISHRGRGSFLVQVYVFEASTLQKEESIEKETQNKRIIERLYYTLPPPGSPH